MLKKIVSANILIIITMTIAIRLILSTLPSFEYDESAYRMWTDRLVTGGPSEFYSSQVFTNNPVGGLYGFWVIGFIKETFLPNLSFFSRGFDFLLKFPANLADILTGLLIYLLVKRKLDEKWANAGYLLYVLNPAIFFNSSIWGQYDGLSTFFIVLATYIILFKKNPELASAAFAIAWAIKPQAVMFAPALIVLVLLTKTPVRWVTAAVALLATLIITYLPFFPQNPLQGLIYVNKNSAFLFNCTSCFAFNFWGIFGNWQSDLQMLFNIPLFAWGIILLCIAQVIILFSKPLYQRFKPPLFYLTAAVTILAFFVFLTRMHERYLFPFFPFMLLSAMTLRSKILIVFYLLMSGLHLLNLYLPYAYYNNLAKITNLPVNNLISNFQIFSLISFLGFISLLIYYLYYVKYKSVS